MVTKVNSVTNNKIPHQQQKMSSTRFITKIRTLYGQNFNINVPFIFSYLSAKKTQLVQMLQHDL